MNVLLVGEESAGIRVLRLLAECDLFETGILDSLQLVELIFKLEQHFGVRMSLDETNLESFRSIERITVALAK